MTAFERFEREIPTLMDELSPPQLPDYVDDMLRQTARTPQRPAWSTLERWLPMGVIAQTQPLPGIPWRAIIVVATIAVLIVAGLLLSVGSRPHLPAPFGPARNGVLLYRDPGGAIMSVDPTTGSGALVEPASEGLGFPVPSRDGRRVAFAEFRSTAPAPIVVTSIDGSDSTMLAGDYREVDQLDWSPDSTHVAVVANSGGRQSIIVAAADGSESMTLDLGREVYRIAYLPDGRLAVIAAERSEDRCDQTFQTCALYLVNADGTGLDSVIPAADFHGIDTIAPSPDGSRLLWVESVIGRDGRLHVFDVRTREDRLLPTPAFPPIYKIRRAWFSPDGESILFDLLEPDGDHWAIIPTTGGSIDRLGPEWPGDLAADGVTPDAAWAPDGRSVVARYPTGEVASELWVLDATGDGQDRNLGLMVPNLPSWQRLAP